MTTDQINTVFYHYPVFRITRRLGFLFKKSVVKQSLFVASLSIGLILIGSLLDQTIILPGSDIGLIEHPTIWTFLIIQIIAPFVFKKAIDGLFDFFKQNDVIESKKDISVYLSEFKNQASRRTNFSKVCYLLLTVFGVICFAWNSFQNQAPYKFLGFDFWDSFNHPFGYWITRVYKLYLWVFLFPAIIHIQISILLTLYKLLKDAEKEKFFILKPYNQDEHAGVGKIIKIAIDPPIPILIIASLSVAGAFLIHGLIEITPVIGLSLLSLLFIFIYLIPAIKLREIIKAEKKRQLTEITKTQNQLYFALVKNSNSNDASERLETLNALTSVYKQVKSISSWPYWKFMLKFVGFINIPVLISIGKSLWPLITKVIQK